MQEICNKIVQDIWAKAQIIWPKLLAYNPPRIVINKRIYRFAGRCWTSDNKIELSYKLYTKHGMVLTQILMQLLQLSTMLAFTAMQMEIFSSMRIRWTITNKTITNCIGKSDGAHYGLHRSV